MAATHGTVSPFDPAAEDWTTYIERLNFYFAANEVDSAEKKRAIFLASCGAATYKLARSLVDSGKLETISYNEICELLQGYYEPKPSVIVQRFKFNTRVRNSGESVATFVAALRALAEHCAYGATLKEMLRDRLVCGVNHEGIQRKLLAEKNLTYDSAFTLAQSIETSERDSKKLKAAPPKPPGDIHFQTRGSRNKPPKQFAAGPSDPAKQRTPVCYRCGGPRLAPACKYLNPYCSYCKKKGHIIQVCKAKERQQAAQGKSKQPSHYVDQESEVQDDAYEEMYAIRDPKCAPITVEVLLNNVPITMEVDTGASATIISQSTLQLIREKSQVDLQPSQAKLRTYTGQTIPIAGCATLQARYAGKQQVAVVVQVVSGDGPNLLGRDWLHKLEVDLGTIQSTVLEQSTTLEEILQKHSEVFSEDLGCMQGTEIHLQVDERAKPKFHKPRTVPFVLREKVEAELEELQRKGIISPVKTSKWAAPIVPVLKKNGKMRLCGDYKLTANQALLTESYPLPRIDELVTGLAGGKSFTKLDMSNAYLQLPLDEQSKEYLVINTHKGLFRYNRLPFGISSAPAIFQRTMETLLQGLPGVSVYLDDILVTGRTTEEHLHNLEAVLLRLKEAGLRLNREKCTFMQPRIEYLGHAIDEKGRHPTAGKVQAIRDAPTPQNVTQLRSFLGIINYYGNFLPNLSSRLTPLYSLLGKNMKWSWGPQQDEAFHVAKEALQADSLLVHFDPQKPLILACDASDYGIGAVLSHVMEDGQERPIAYTSRTLSGAEKRYSQLDKEALAIVSGVKKFHNYVYGRSFTIQSDHQPLFYLFNEQKGIPQHASARIQRWALTLSGYRYNIRYKAGKTLSNADALSRLPRPVPTTTDVIPADLDLLVNHLSTTCICAANIKEWTSKDPTLAQLQKFILSGWPEKSPSKDFSPYFAKKDELSLMDGCVLWGTRVLVPPPGRKGILEELHETHPGISRMKSLARSYIWWPKMDADIETLVRGCQTCQVSRPSPPAAPLHPWVWPEKPWSRLHIDYAGPYCGSMFLVLVDAHSKWMDVVIMKNITAATTIEKLRIIFATHGFPQKVVTDNGPSFTSQQFKDFMSKNGVIHITSAPYHPSTNGLAERAVQSFKQGLKRTAGDSIQDRLSRYLFKYRITPHTTTGISPAELLMGRRLHSRMDLLYPDVSRKVQAQQLKQKLGHDNSSPLRSFQVGDTVYAENFSHPPPKWLPGKVIRCSGPLSYEVEVQSGIVRRHIDNLRKRSAHDQPNTDIQSSDPVDPLTQPDLPTTPEPAPPAPAVDTPPLQEDAPAPLPPQDPQPQDPPPQDPPAATPTPPPEQPRATPRVVRKSTRRKRKPKY